MSYLLVALLVLLIVSLGVILLGLSTAADARENGSLSWAYAYIHGQHAAADVQYTMQLFLEVCMGISGASTKSVSEGSLLDTAHGKALQ
jgi:hypothetical protein